jgi:hypothetical protein
MRKLGRFSKLFFTPVLCLGLINCVASIPKGFLKPSAGNLETRQLQIRQYATKDQVQIITAVAGVLQDLGFTLDESESELGLVSASKKADASRKGEKFLAGLADFLGALSGSSSNISETLDDTQVVKASVIAKPSLDEGKTVVRITIQRIVWTQGGQISKVESVKEPGIYEKFYDSLSKAIFLEAQKI